MIRCERVEIPTGGTIDGEGDSVSNSDNAQMTGHIISPSEVSKTRVEDLVKRLTIDEMNSKWFDEIFNKVKSELAEKSPVSPQHTPPSSQASSPMSQTSKLSFTPRGSAYQATVEDDPEDEMSKSAEQTGDTAQRPSSNIRGNSPVSSLVSESTSSGHQSSWPKSALVNTSTTSSSPQSSPRASHSVRFRDRGPVVLHAETRPSPAEVDGQGARRYSVVDQKWGVLFDQRGEPTARLGQLLRGIANYMIAIYAPANSLVLTPEKLQAFYTTYKVDSEILPYQQIFDCRPRGALDNLECLYQQLRCEHHLVQGGPSSMPHIPSLTPSGFEKWMVCQITAFPEQEAQRLGRVIADLPIIADGSFLDDKPERLPRQLSRHLFPAEHNSIAHNLVLDVMATWIRNAEYEDMVYRKSYRDDTYKIRSSKEESGRRRRSGERRRSEDGSKHRHGSKDGYKSSRTEDTNHYTSRDSIRHSLQEPPVPSKHHSRDSTRHSLQESPVPSKHHSRSPVSNRRSASTATVDSHADEYGIVSSGHRSDRRRNREKDYRVYQGRSNVDMTPRSANRDERRQNLVVDTQGGYDDDPRSSRRMYDGAGSSDRTQDWHG